MLASLHVDVLTCAHAHTILLPYKSLRRMRTPFFCSKGQPGAGPCSSVLPHKSARRWRVLCAFANQTDRRMRITRFCFTDRQVAHTFFSPYNVRRLFIFRYQIAQKNTHQGKRFVSRIHIFHYLTIRVDAWNRND